MGVPTFDQATQRLLKCYLQLLPKHAALCDNDVIYSSSTKHTALCDNDVIYSSSTKHATLCDNNVIYSSSTKHAATIMVLVM
jgi:predicted ABC-type ATPase